MTIELNGFRLELGLSYVRHGWWIELPVTATGVGAHASTHGLTYELILSPEAVDRLAYTLRFTSEFLTRIRLTLKLLDQADLFHLIPGNIHGDNNAAHVRPGEFPVLATDRLHERNRSPLWEFRADRAAMPVSMLCCTAGSVGVSVEPYSDCPSADEQFIHNGLISALPNAFGVSLGYGNDPMTFSEKTQFFAATADLHRGAETSGHVYAVRGRGRADAHQIIRDQYARRRELPTHQRTYAEGLRALAESFANVNYSPQLKQYTNRKCTVPTQTTLEPWRAIVEIGWTGGGMLAYPLELAQRIFPDLPLPKTGATLFDEICSGWNDASGFINDTAVNRFTQNRPDGWNASDINGWWSGFLPQSRDNHCAYTNAHAAYYMLQMAALDRAKPLWTKTALAVLETAIDLQREDGAFGYIFSGTEKQVVDWEGFAGCWFAAALPLAWKLTGELKYRDACVRAIRYYRPFVANLAAWGSPMDTFKSIDSEGNIAFVRAVRLMHQLTGEQEYLDGLLEGAEYEYLWRYGYRTRPAAAPLKGSGWNSCGGTITSVSNPHLHPMGVVLTEDLLYLARHIGDPYHAQRAEDGLAWLMNTMELYPSVTGYGQFGVLSERTCPSDGLLNEKFYDTGEPSSTWWSYNAWAAASAMEALAERILATSNR